MAYTYRARYEERIESGAIVHGTPEAVARWFEARWQPPEAQEFTKWAFEDSQRGLLEHLAVRRREPLIDHAVARWGYSLRSIQRVHDRGGASTRMAALANPRGGALLSQAVEVVRAGRLADLQAMLQNQFIGGSFLDNVIRRAGAFGGLPDDRLLRVIWCLKGNKRLQKISDSADGMTAYYFQRPLNAVWELALTIPVDAGWASSLESLLALCRGAIPREKAREAMERWQIDPPAKPNAAWYDRPPSFRLRAMLANALPADGELLTSEDTAARVSFYRRFQPQAWKEWPLFFDRDGSDFIAAAIENERLWVTEDLRQALLQVCGKCPDPSTYYATMQGDFWARERIHQAKHPEWFAYREDPAPAQPADSTTFLLDIMAVQRFMLEGMESARARLDGIEAAIRAIPPPRRGLF